MSSTELFKKHFNGKAAVDLKHPNMEAFFEELNVECLAEDLPRKCFVITEIQGIKQYVRRKSISAAGRAAVTMTTTNKSKAFDFGSVKKATDFKNRLGIGYAIEVDK